MGADDDREKDEPKAEGEPASVPDPSQTFVGRGLTESLRRSQAVLRLAKSTREAIYGRTDPPGLPADPVERAAEVLRRAAQVRREASRNDGGSAEAVERAQRELARLRGSPPAPDEVDADEASPSERPPRRREL
jgi:hypothetical protein